MKIATQAIHVGQEPDPTTGATVPPIYATSTFTQEAPGKHKGYEYARGTNPTRDALARCLAALEGGAAGMSFASGLAATNALVCSLCRPGDSVVAFSDMYGGTYRLLERIFRPWGLEVRYCDDTRPDAIAGLVDDTTRIVWIETPTNPMLRLLDIAAVSQAVRAKAARTGTRPISRRGGSPMDHDFGMVLVVDNTFASPALQQPISLGADVVVHSTTKYLGGHSDVVGGAIVTAKAETMAPIKFFHNAAGGVSGPFDCFLTHRGVKTLAVRMKAHCENAMHVARWAASQRGFQKVIYPGLETHPDHELARRQMAGFGGMVTVVLPTFDQASRFMAATCVFSCAESLGGVESLVNHPAVMTHASIPKEVRERIGITDGLVRLSVGIEDKDDLVADLEQALRKECVWQVPKRQRVGPEWGAWASGPRRGGCGTWECSRGRLRYVA
ncbi:MAG: PLP-dependent transferase [Planctomycetes bacterium]|nr:PLP-dependent transferase [Planctomycetota bacterium]